MTFDIKPTLCQLQGCSEGFIIENIFNMLAGYLLSKRSYKTYTYRAVVTDTIIPEVTCGELFADDNSTAHKKSLSSSKNTPGRVIKGECVINDLSCLHFEEIVHRKTHVKKSEMEKNYLRFDKII